MSRIDLVGVGSLYAIERDGAVIAGGIAAEAALAAKARGASAIPVARVGTDRFGREVTECLRSAGLDVSSIQADADLATPRRVQRGSTARLEPYAAFDNLQFDSDVEALARVAESIITDSCSRRQGQARSAIDRMLVAAPNAVRILDLVRRAPPALATSSAEDRVDRETFGNAHELCQMFVVDRTALRAFVPAATDLRDGAKRLAAQTHATAVIALADRTALLVHGAEIDEFEGWSAERSCDVAVCVALAAINGRALRDALAKIA